MAINICLGNYIFRNEHKLISSNRILNRQMIEAQHTDDDEDEAFSKREKKATTFEKWNHKSNHFILLVVFLRWFIPPRLFDVSDHFSVDSTVSFDRIFVLGFFLLLSISFSKFYKKPNVKSNDIKLISFVFLSKCWLFSFLWRILFLEFF